MDVLKLADETIAKAEATRRLSVRDPQRWSEIELDHVAMLDVLRKFRDHYGGHLAGCQQITEAASSLSALYSENPSGEWLLKPKMAQRFRPALFKLLTLLRDA